MPPKLKNTFKRSGRVLATLVIVVIAGIAAWFAWQHYVYAPWTRDGRVQANVVNIAPNVSGTVQYVAVANNSYVHKGELLFQIDKTRFQLAIKEAKAKLAKAKAKAAYDRKHANRLANLPSGAISEQKLELARSQAKASEAAVQIAESHLAQAKQKLAWTSVESPVNGYVTYLLLTEGDYAQRGQKVLILVDASSFHVTAYFQETKLASIEVGDPATINLVSRDGEIEGHVKSISYGIAIANATSGERNLPKVNPQFRWVRLAQRVPVQIAFDHPEKVGRLAVGLTATVHVQPDESGGAN